MGLAGDSSHRQAAAVPGIKLCRAYAYNANQTALGWVEGWCMPRSHSFQNWSKPQNMQVQDQLVAKVQIHHRTSIALSDQPERLCCCSKTHLRPHWSLYTRPVTASPQHNKCHCNCHRCLQRVSSTNRSMQGHMLLLLAALLALSVPAGAQTAEGTSGGRKYPSFDGSRNNGENPAWG